MPTVKNKLPYMKAAAESVIENINTQWDAIYDTPFTEILTKLPSTNLSQKNTDAERKEKLRNIHRKLKTNLENSWQENSKDTNTLLGTSQSYVCIFKS